MVKDKFQMKICKLNFGKKVLVSFMLSFYLVFFIGLSFCSALENFNESGNFSNVTREMALESIEESAQIVLEMKKENFSTEYMEDLLIEANRTFKQAEYVEILNGGINASNEKVLEARRALALIDWRKIDYSNVFSYTLKIKERKTRAFFIYDSLLATGLEINDLKMQGIDTAEAEILLGESENFFYQDQYDDASQSLEKTKSFLEQISLESATFMGLQKGTRNFFEKYWISLIFLFIFCTIVSFLIYKKVSLNFLKKNIMRLSAEREILFGLMKTAQKERFNENKLSGLIYTIKMQKYREKLNEINQELPILENKLKNSL